MDKAEELWGVMNSSDDRQAYSAFQQLARLTADVPVLSNHTDDLVDMMAPRLHDFKPTVVRQCVQAMPRLSDTSPNLTRRIVRELESIDPNAYRDSMGPLVAGDTADALAKIHEQGFISPLR